MKKIILHIFITAILFALMTPILFAFADTSRFIEFEYEDRPTLRIERKYADSEDIIEEKKLYYETMTDIIPIEIRKKLKDRHVIVYIVENCKRYYGSNPPKFVIGFFEAPSNRIVISIESFEIALCHELGHAVAYIYGSLDESKEYKAAYNNDNKIDQYASKKEVSEAFADIFSGYIHCLNTETGGNYMSKSNLMKSHPEEVRYMQERLNLKAIDEGLVYSGINVSLWRMKQRYWFSKDIENIEDKMIRNAYAPFLLKQIANKAGAKIAQMIKLKEAYHD